jgi:hypothetical protein
MAKKYITCIFVVLILFLFTAKVHAWDGQRKGFLLGFGTGPGVTSFTQKVRVGVFSEESPREDKLAVMTDFKIGYAPDNSWAIYYTSKVSFFGITNVFGNKVTVANGLGALAGCYWFNQQAPSPFVAGGLGFSTWSLPFEENPPDTWIGPGLFAGGGYEFSRHVTIEGYFSWGKPKDEEFGIEASSNALSLMFTLNVLGY